jgi:hypothetical protein
MKAGLSNLPTKRIALFFVEVAALPSTSDNREAILDVIISGT